VYFGGFSLLSTGESRTTVAGDSPRSTKVRSVFVAIMTRDSASLRCGFLQTVVTLSKDITWPRRSTQGVRARACQSCLDVDRDGDPRACTHAAPLRGCLDGGKKGCDLFLEEAVHRDRRHDGRPHLSLVISAFSIIG